MKQKKKKKKIKRLKRVSVPVWMIHRIKIWSILMKTHDAICFVFLFLSCNMLEDKSGDLRINLNADFETVVMHA